MEKINEKLENIEEIMDLLIGQMKSQDEKLSVIVAHNTSVHDKNKALVNPEDEVIPSREEISNLHISMNTLEEKLAHLPEVFKVKHQHHYEIKSKFYFIAAITIFLVVAISTGSSISLIFRNRELKTASDKLKVIRGAYPGLASEVDGLYLKDKDNLIKNAEMQIHQNQLLMEASFNEAQAKKDYEKARQSKKILKGKQAKVK